MAIAWPTSIDFVVAYLAVLAAGCVAVPLNPNSPPAEIGRELEVVTPAALLAGGAAGRLVTEMGEAIGFAPVVVLPDLWAVLSADPGRRCRRWGRRWGRQRLPGGGPRRRGHRGPALHVGDVGVGRGRRS